MTKLMTDWLSRKWRREPAPDLARAYVVTFGTLEGQLVLQDLMDELYCQPCLVQDALALAEHNGQRKLIHRILEAIDQGRSPDKYETVTPNHEEMSYGIRHD